MSNLNRDNQTLLPIIDREGIHLIDSRVVADELGIKHTNLMQTIYKYQPEIESFGLITFQTEAVKNENSRGAKYQKIAYLTEDQAIFIGTLSRNTPKVVAFKAKLVQSFAKARKFLEKPMSTWDIMEFAIKQLREQERINQETNQRLTRIEAKQSSINEDYYTLAGYYSLRRQKWNLSNTQSQQLGRALSLKSKALNYPINKAYDSKYGEVNSYHKDILEQVLNF